MIGILPGANQEIGVPRKHVIPQEMQIFTVIYFLHQNTPACPPSETKGRNLRLAVLPFYFHRANSNKMNFFNELADSPTFGRPLALLPVDACAWPIENMNMRFSQRH